MNIEQLDQTLAKWKEDIETLRKNIVELQSLMIYREMTGWSNVLTGQTKRKADSALDALSKVDLKYMPLLKEAIAVAAEKRKELPKYFPPQEKLAKIETLLTGQSITLEITIIPLEQRNALGPSERIETVSPPQIKEMIISGYDLAKRQLLELRDSLAALDEKLTVCSDQVALVRQEAQSHGAGETPELIELRTQLEAIKSQRYVDPLGMGNPITAMQPYQTRAAHRIAQCKRDREQIAASVTDGQRCLNDLITLHEKAHAWLQKGRRAGYAINELKEPASIRELENQLAPIVHDLAEQRWTEVKSAIHTWLDSCKKRSITLQSEIDFNKSLVAKANDPAFQVYRAKCKIEELLALRVRARSAYDQCLKRIADPKDLVMPDRLTDLDNALKEVTAHLENKRTAEALAAVTVWFQSYETMLAAMNRALRVNQSLLDKSEILLDKNDELRNRWNQLKLATAAHERNGLKKDKALTRYEELIEKLLNAEQPDPVQVKRALDAYDTCLGERAPKPAAS